MTAHTILVSWKNEQGEIAKKETYTSLKCFVEYHNEYSEHTINNSISRKKVPFEDKRVILEKLIKIGRESKNK